MPKTHRVELTVPISEDQLLEFLLARYPEETLVRVGITPSNSVIRNVTIAADGKCHFRICVLTLTDTEQVLKEETARMVENYPDETTAIGETEQSSPEKSIADIPQRPCVAKQLQALRVEKAGTSSNS